MTLEYAGAVELDPPFTHDEIGYVRRLAGDEESDGGMAWLPSRDGTTLRPERGAEVDVLADSLGYLVATMERPGRFRGLVAVYDDASRELFGISVANGRVTTRVLRKPRSASPTARSNVIDLSTRRRATNRRIG